MLRSLCWSLLLLAGLASVAPAAESDPKFGFWPQWRGPERNGRSTEEGLLQDWRQNPPKLLWTTEGFGEGYASVAIADGMIFTTGNTGSGQAVIAAKAENGEIVWTTKITEQDPNHSYEGSRSTPTIDGDRLYVVGSNGSIHCLKVDDGSVVWSKDFKKEWNGQMMSGWGFAESPLVDGDAVLCTPGGPKAMVVKLKKASGEPIWACEMPNIGDRGKDGAGYSSIQISNAGGVKQYVQLVGRGTIGIRASDGKFLWGYNNIANPVANIPTPIVKDEYVLTATGYREGGTALLKLSASGDGVKAEEVWYHEANKLQNHHGGMVMLGDYVFFGHGHNNGFPVCVEWKSGDIVWGGRQRGAGGGSAAVVYADGNFIFRYQSGEVALIEATPDGYRLKGSFKPEYKEKDSWAHPVVAGGRLYLREQNKLMCYDLKAK